jgi:hypothetical protein
MCSAILLDRHKHIYHYYYYYYYYYYHKGLADIDLQDAHLHGRQEELLFLLLNLLYYNDVTVLAIAKAACNTYVTSTAACYIFFFF